MAEREAKTFFKQVVITRAWNAAHGGVYVLATKDSPPNDYLMEDERTLKTEDGIVLAKINPAYMTRQLSSIARSDRDIRFNITSLDPVHPANAADQWEVDALRDFNQGLKEKFELVSSEDHPVFRYMAPLYSREECMRCHAGFGHAGRPILGGISISFPAGPYINTRKSVVAQTHFAFTLIFLVGLFGICGSTYLVQRKREEAERANRTKSVFLANMSHDMRTPLNGIMGLTELMRKKGLEPGMDRYAEMVRHSAWTLLEIITDITDFSRLESGRLELSDKVFDIHELLNDALAVFRFETANKGLSLNGEVAVDVPDLLIGDPFRLKQVLTNLVGNAVKFTFSGYVNVRISLGEFPDFRADDHHVDSVKLRFEIEDSGIGIPEDEQEVIFESFRQVDSSHYKAHEGTGLGLAICKELVSMMNGTISVTSQNGKGSTFSFEVILSLPGDGVVIDDSSVGETGKNKICSSCRVLVVDDNPLNRIFASEILEDEGHLVTVAENGKQALEFFINHDFDIVFMDVQMPEMDGLEATRKLRAGAAGNPGRLVPIVAITAFAVSEDREQCLMAGMNGYIAKPLESHEILNALATYSGKELIVDDDNLQENKIMTAGYVDMDKALERLGGRKELFVKLAETFLLDTPPKLTLLREAVFSENMDEVLRLAHSLKNSAGMIQADDMSKKAEDLEMCVREKRLADLVRLNAGLEKSAGETFSSLRRIVGK